MTTSLFRHLLNAVCAVSLVAFTSHSVLADAAPTAGVTLTLDDPFPTVVIPSSGSITHTFTGTVSFSPGLAWELTNLQFPFINGANPGIITGSNINVPYPGTENGGIFSGGLFSFEINSTHLPGLYDERFGGGSAIFEVSATDGTTTFSDSAAFSITLVNPSTTVPESSSAFLAPFLVGILALARSFQRRA